MTQARIQRFAKGKTYNLSEISAANKTSKDWCFSESYLTALVEFIGKLEDNHVAYFAGMDWSWRDCTESKRGVTFGDKWDKVWVLRDGKKSRIVCHIDSNTGIIYKSNGWQGAPYPKPRADIYQPESYEYADPHGGWLYADFNANEARRRNDSSVKAIIEKGEAIMSDK